MVALSKAAPATLPTQRGGWQHRKEANMLVIEISHERFKYVAIKIATGK